MNRNLIFVRGDTRISKSDRDVQNEKPRQLSTRAKAETKSAQTGTSAILHTTYGDIHVRLFPDAAPKAVENFVTHSRNGYYNNTIFHRIIRKFMIQVSPLLSSSYLFVFQSNSPQPPITHYIPFLNLSFLYLWTGLRKFA